MFLLVLGFEEKPLNVDASFTLIAVNIFSIKLSLEQNLEKLQKTGTLQSKEKEFDFRNKGMR